MNSNSNFWWVCFCPFSQVLKFPPWALSNCDLWWTVSTNWVQFRYTQLSDFSERSAPNSMHQRYNEPKYSAPPISTLLYGSFYSKYTSLFAQCTLPPYHWDYTHFLTLGAKKEKAELKGFIFRSISEIILSPRCKFIDRLWISTSRSIRKNCHRLSPTRKSLFSCIEATQLAADKSFGSV